MSITIRQLIDWKHQRRPIVALTAWDWSFARLLDAAGADLILVGDSLAMVALGHATTLPVTLDEMLHHAAAVRRGVERALVVCDLPFMSFQESSAQAIRSAGRALKEAGVQAVKLEGGHAAAAASVERLVEAGIPVMGHVGLTPQSVHRLGFRQQGKTPTAAERIAREASALAEAGAFAIVLEHIPSELAARITADISIPTIGIGAGTACDGQVLVTADLLGLSPRQPPFAKAYADLGAIVTRAVKDYAEDVRSRRFPDNGAIAPTSETGT
ncbi:3-methyl-2-oxobutanoate hydroxymethyltransferase [Rubidibacter lacunae KORDI 51-2]|uniref:3-methyl-2-oxobutanoate hydroxymethyltransferase n=1 Tax=Rubidibacter lacunae KORDI 51-2 TaxID=582515 RepID=U5DH38_9CHRO|nr:3-methyl-2-oxobutanoate hydroxymethyltransferase [Rubidibacter lacunae]ERN40911.1 3-methyl-2-oxobutanoate hydroxymethyltransferase [Rubidibacter lacunae KORDI 51-2]